MRDIPLTEHRFLSFDATPIFYRKAGDFVKGMVVILHGMGEHGGRYRHLAQSLGEAGLGCLIPDLRGFGQSGGDRACVRKFSDFHEDLQALLRFARNRLVGDLPIFLLGHSFGALVASSYAAFYPDRFRVWGLVLTSPSFGLAFKVPPWRRFLGLAGSYLFPDFSQPSPVRSEVLTHDPGVLDQYNRDKLICHRVSARLYREFMRMMKRTDAIASRIEVPILVLQAGQDSVVSKDQTLRFYSHLRSRDRELEVYPDFYHEILNEIRRSVVLARIVQWLLRHAELGTG